MPGDSFFSSVPAKKQAVSKREKPSQEEISPQEGDVNDFTVFLFFFDEAKGHLPLITYPKNLKQDKKAIQTIKIHPIWWIPEEDEDARDPAVFEFGGKGYIANKFRSYSQREKHRPGMSTTTFETFVLALGAPRDFIFLGQELLPLLQSRILSLAGNTLYLLCERELSIRKPLKTAIDKKRIEEGNNLEKNLIRVCRETLPSLSVSRLQQRRDVQSRLQRRMAQIFLEDMSAVPAQGVRRIVLGSKIDQAQPTPTPQRQEIFKVTDSGLDPKKKTFYVTIKNSSSEQDLLEDLLVTISKIKGFFEREKWESHVSTWNHEESVRFEAPIGDEEEAEILIRIVDENQKKLLLKKIHYQK